MADTLWFNGRSTRVILSELESPTKSGNGITVEFWSKADLAKDSYVFFFNTNIFRAPNRLP